MAKAASKSESVLALIERGNSLVADDITAEAVKAMPDNYAVRAAAAGRPYSIYGDHPLLSYAGTPKQTRLWSTEFTRATPDDNDDAEVLFRARWLGALQATIIRENDAYVRQLLGGQ